MIYRKYRKYISEIIVMGRKTILVIDLLLHIGLAAAFAQEVTIIKL